MPDIFFDYDFVPEDNGDLFQVLEYEEIQRFTSVVIPSKFGDFDDFGPISQSIDPDEEDEVVSTGTIVRNPILSIPAIVVGLPDLDGLFDIAPIIVDIGPVTGIGHGCENSAVSSGASDIAARDAADGRSGTDQPEYGFTTAEAANGEFVNSIIRQGTSYDEANPPSAPMAPPSGFSWSDVVATTHSHPASGDSGLDNRNQAPSDADWAGADEIVLRGADPSRLTLYIIDADGVMRAFDYMTPAERGATSGNPSGTQDNGSAGTVVDSGGSSGC